MKLLSVLALSTAFLSMGAFTAPLKAQAPLIKLCTGSSVGVYFQVGKMISDMSGNTIEVIETQGTFENMDRLLSGDPTGCDAMIGQPDGPVFLKRTAPNAASKITAVMKLQAEYLQVLCSRESGIDNLSELSSSNSVAIGAQGSGAWLIWQNFIEQDSSYGEIPVTADSGITALTSVAFNQTTCMIVPSGVPNGIVNEADANFGDTVALVSANDKDFNDAEDIDGKDLYTFDELPTESYPVTFNRGWSDIDTIRWNAALYVSKEKLSGKNLEGFLRAATRARTQILAKYGK